MLKIWEETTYPLASDIDLDTYSLSVKEWKTSEPVVKE